MTSSNPTSGKTVTITSVELAWVDMGVKTFNVFFTRENGSKWMLRQKGSDELDAYVRTLKGIGAD